MTKAHRLKTRRPGAVTKGLPLNFLLGCAQRDLDEFELGRLAEVADLRKELHEILDRMIDAMTQAAMASWFKSQDRNSLKHAIENEESPEEWAKRMIRDGQRSEEELEPAAFLSPTSFRTSLPPGEAHRAASLRYQRRQIASGLCRYCPKRICDDSIDMCEVHLAKARERKREQSKALGRPPRGRSPRQLEILARQREKQTFTTPEQRALWDRVAKQLGVSALHVRNVATGVKTSAKVAFALRLEARKRSKPCR